MESLGPFFADTCNKRSFRQRNKRNVPARGADSAGKVPRKDARALVPGRVKGASNNDDTTTTHSFSYP